MRSPTSIGRTGSVAASCTSFRGAESHAASVSLASCNCSPGCRIRSSQPSPRRRRSRTTPARAACGSGSGGLYRLAFGRPSLCGSLDQLRQADDNPWEGAFDATQLCSPLSAGWRLPGQPRVRQPWPQRTPRPVAAAGGPGPVERVCHRQDARGAAVGHLQSVQHRQLRVAQQRHRRPWHRLWPDYGYVGWARGSCRSG